jgi:uncharacterized circularly permuted ATP-grasp superfamily protein
MVAAPARIVQRVKALEHYLDDIYGDQESCVTTSSRAGW